MGELHLITIFADRNSIFHRFKVPKTKIETYCEMDYRSWPFDIQECTVKMGSWTYDSYKLNLTAGNSAVSISMNFL